MNNIKQRLAGYADACRQRIPVHLDNSGQLALDALTEIERLESELTKEIASHAATLELWGKVAAQYKAQKK